MPHKMKSLKSKSTAKFDEQIFHRMFEGHSAVMLLIEAKTGAILDANHAAVNFYGYSKLKLCSMSIQDINTLPPEQVAMERQKAFTNERNYFIFSHRLASGEERTVEVYSSPIALQEEPAIFSIIHDISERRLVNEELRRSEERYRTLFDNMMDGIYRSTHAGKFVDVNPALVRMFGYSSRDEMLDVDIKKDLYFLPEERGSHILDTGQEEVDVYRMRRKDGSEIWVEDHGYYVHDEQGNILYHEGMLRDITARKRADEIVRESEARLAAVMEGSQLGFSDWNIQTGKVLRNERWAEILGYSLKEIEPTYQLWEDLLHPDDRASVLQAMQDHLDRKTSVHRDEYRLRAKDGSYRWILDQGKIVEYDPQGRPLRMTATHTDITSRKEAEAELRQAKDALEVTHRELEQAFVREQQLARIDMLTGVHNRRFLFELAAHEFNMALRYKSQLSVLMFDIDNFKLINDGFGHPIGDQALQFLTRVVASQLRSVDVLGRYGGDEFIVLLPQTGTQDAQVLGERIHASIAAMHIDTEKGPLRLTISLGIAQLLHHAVQPDTVDNLLLRADQALYAAKVAGRNRTVIMDTE
jgi:diguanylate cyclase (GGDEF)-like protein/PAS domain S-box-containing protein